MSKEETTLGKIHVSPNAIATIAYHATLRSYGVVGLAAKNLASGLAQSITRDPNRGVSVHHNDENIDIDIYIIVQHGTNIASVARSVANTVRYHVEKALGVRINSIDVHVAGLRVGDGTGN